MIAFIRDVKSMFSFDTRVGVIKDAVRGSGSPSLMAWLFCITRSSIHHHHGHRQES